MTSKALLALLALTGVSVVPGCSFETAEESPEAPSGGIFTDRAFDAGAALEVRSAGDDAESTADAAEDAPPEDLLSEEVPPEDVPMADPQILHVASTVVQAEYDRASVALTRARVSEVKAFAADVLREHGSSYPALDLIQIIGLSKNSLSSELSEEAAGTLASLSGATDAEFDALYLNAQVQAGERALDLIDAELTPRAEASQVRDYLRTFRARIEKQLSSAKALGGTRP